ncbi:MAG TPA: hypothetical protein PLZ60_09920 [Kiritimatiellia bacterium]|nr:hypothetical protein [Kiritimatiellia bacterium]
MTRDRRAAIVQLASMLRSAHAQLSQIYKSEQAEVEAQAVAIEAGDTGDIFIRRPIYELAGALQLLYGCVENMECAIESELPP